MCCPKKNFRQRPLKVPTTSGLDKSVHTLYEEGYQKAVC